MAERHLMVEMIMADWNEESCNHYASDAIAKLQPSDVLGWSAGIWCVGS